MNTMTTDGGAVRGGTLHAWFTDGAKGWVQFWYFPAGDYSVVSTDYTSYSVVRNCDAYFFGLFRFEVYWILSRDKTASSATLSTATGALSTKVPTYSQTANFRTTYTGANCKYED